MNGVNNILKSAANEPSIKRFVYTSSSVAAATPKINVKETIDSNTWNEEAVKQAWASPPYNDDRKIAVYSASKTQGEQALWKFVKEQKPSFVANAVLPNANFGKILIKGQPASTGGWVIQLYNEGSGPLKDFPPRKSHPETLLWNISNM